MGPTLESHRYCNVGGERKRFLISGWDGPFARIGGISMEEAASESNRGAKWGGSNRDFSATWLSGEADLRSFPQAAVYGTASRTAASCPCISSHEISFSSPAGSWRNMRPILSG